ncbi:adenosylmethionine--8-amino-7-oxononanoate transaminase [Arthrobacter sp. MYb229]|uniref:adenosylmethionine--8-amino-7-oxononanoate transaminase n=1 Tax=unclassified Arthrobacter TaxID=235627 RepID=UPI000CFD2F0F|nr:MULTISPECIES: adenosylmethionine--8-amino-7-oxononanoate transaminase [unclassified Arthrobacter]PRA02458.1 adenosylmethionine--8-amino-7-oxononanoate transaminase [Arthrobacter sp. MYb229]PRB50599.1 adenosylmethionine--8-amino-7-oxononanoate transaminase [Arthrobacter sp. MYb216]
MPTDASLLSRDAGLLWHPYAALDAGAGYAVTEARGARLVLEDETGIRREVIDGMSSWWSAVHGYRNPALDAAARGQLEKFSHVMFGGLTHAPAIELAERLVDLAPGELRHVFLADSGSISVEVALKLALQYQEAKGRTTRHRFAALRGGYHGDTFATMGICDPQDGMHAAFAPRSSAELFLPKPPSARRSAQGHWEYLVSELADWECTVRALISENSAQLAGIVCEPVLQGAGGMHIYPPAALGILRELADEHDLPLIADEIATGFGRTGELFAVAHAGIVPDIMCVGKALTGGYLTLAAMLCTSKIGSALASGTRSAGSALLHGPTFMGNPLACAVACASLDLLVGAPAGSPPAAPWQAQVTALESGLRTGLAPAAGLASVKDVRVLGGVGVIQLHAPVDVPEVTRAAVAQGVWVRPFRDLVYVMPPYISTPEELAALGRGLLAAVEQVHG